MIEDWILTKIDPHRRAPLIILRDPQRMIQPGAQVVDGWAEENGFTVLFCAGNLALREMYEFSRDDSDTRLLLVDRSREDAKIPLFYPDIDTHVGRQRRLALSLQEFLIERTHDSGWPALVNDRNLSRLILQNLPATLEAYARFRTVRQAGFSDPDLYRIVLGAALGLNSFRTLGAADIRRVCLEHHQTLEDLQRVLPANVMETWRQDLARAPKPFCWLLERDPQLVIRSFTLAALLHQHGLDYSLLLSNLDPALHEYREIDPAFLKQAMQEQLTGNMDRVSADVQDAEAFLTRDPQRLSFLLQDQLKTDDPKQALKILEAERLSPMIRSFALFSLLINLLTERDTKFHAKVAKLLEKQNRRTDMPALYRPSDQWRELVDAYHKALKTLELTARTVEHVKRLQVTPVNELTFEQFDQLWNKDGLNRLDYYLSDLRRIVRVGAISPVAPTTFWPNLSARWAKAREELEDTASAANRVQNLFNLRFQDLYAANYLDWIQRADAPVIFTHQFLDRLLKAYWDPQSKQKAVIMVFDGLRTDAWDELLRPVFEERYQLIASHPGSALLPTETQLSRKAIAAGTLPADFTVTSELGLLTHWLRDRMGINPRLDVVKNEDTGASGMTVRFVSDPLEYIIFNFTDHNLHNNAQDLAFIYNTTVHEIIRQDVRSVLRDLPEDALIFITSDHGFAPTPEQPLLVAGSLVAENADIKYRNARLKTGLPANEEKFYVSFDVRRMGIPQTSEANGAVKLHSVVFPRPTYTLKRPSGPHNPDRYTHGGLSLAECMVPMVVMGPKQGIQPLLRIDRFVQTGSVREGEVLTLELTLSPMRIGDTDRAIALNFSRDEIPARREILPGKETTYTIAWTPKLDAIGEAERQTGEVRLPVTVVISYNEDGNTVRLSRSADVRVKLDTNRLRRRVDSKLDLLMGKVPKGLQS